MDNQRSPGKATNNKMNTNINKEKIRSSKSKKRVMKNFKQV